MDNKYGNWDDYVYKKNGYNSERLIDQLTNLATSDPTIEIDDVQFVKDYIIASPEEVLSFVDFLVIKKFTGTILYLVSPKSHAIRLLNHAGINIAKEKKNFKINDQLAFMYRLNNGEYYIDAEGVRYRERDFKYSVDTFNSSIIRFHQLY